MASAEPLSDESLELSEKGYKSFNYIYKLQKLFWRKIYVTILTQNISLFNAKCHFLMENVIKNISLFNEKCHYFDGKCYYFDGKCYKSLIILPENGKF
jgi:hypothetical protein